ncbi:MAG: T9SS type A sorting domain-containing protein [Candidatus Sabulitectum sp.]|nr:T9SS type A sorting domain-containing protein [Candidatus Sabulitectum sp.]
MITFFLLSMVLGMGRYAVDGTFHFPEIQQMDLRHDPVNEPTGPLAGKDGSHEVGDVINFWAIDESGTVPMFYLTSATCRFSGELSYIFVEDTQWGINFDQNAVDSLSAALEGSSGIMARDTEFFGDIPDLIDNDPRVYYLILNIRDGYASGVQNWYIAGYFSPYNMFTEYEARNYYGGHSNEVEMLYIDCYPGLASEAMLTASHELVHLIQYGIKPFSGEELWVLENQAQAGTFLCGYPAPQVETFVDFGGVSPIKWTEFSDGEKVVAGYGAGYLFFSYLFENYGGKDFIWNSMHGTTKGMQGVIDAIESATGETADMEEILSDWMLSCFIDDPALGYGWESFSIADYDTTDSGNRPGLDYTGMITDTPWSDPWHDVTGYQGNYYNIGDDLTGSLRVEGSGIGNLNVFFFDGNTVTELDAGSAYDVAVGLENTGTLMLICNSFAGLEMNVAAGSIGGGGNFAVFPNPCLGDLYFQFTSTGESILLSFFDQTGAHVETLTLSASSGETVISYTGASELASGIYFYRFQQGSRLETGRVAVVR